MGVYQMHKFFISLLEYKILLKFWILFLVVGALFRTLLSTLFLESFNSDFFYGLLYGFRMDTIYFSLFSIIFSILYALNLIRFSRLFFTFVFSVYLILELSTITFMSQFLARPNSLFVEHFKNIEELTLMVWGLYKFYLIIGVPIVALLIYILYNFFKKEIKRGDVKTKLIALPLLLAILFLGVRSSVGMSTPNPSYYTFSSNDLNNEIANNSLFSLLYSIYLLKKEKFYDYGDISPQDAIREVQKLNHISNKELTLNRFQKSLFQKEKNIILVILESFGQHNIGYLGGTQTTPNLDSYTKESLYFTNLYAVGTRTSWGVSSTLTSLYPIPSREYVKASKSQKNFYTIATTLKKHGYHNTFLYSGDANFDNMRGFMLNNGYDDVYGKESFDSDKKSYTWGYNDEDLFDRAFTLIEQKKDKPYFLTLLTLSSHEPFDYPKDRVKPYKDAPLKGFANSIKYTDYAIGKFITKLKKKGMMKDTVIAFVADHCSKAYSANGVPIDRYKIVAMILSDDFKGGKEYSKIASQIDIAPTLLDIAGVSDTLPTMGSSVLQNQRDSALLLANKRNFAYLTKEGYVLYRDKRNHKMYDYNNRQIEANPKLIKDGLSYIYGSKYLYDNRLYR
jgi:phosphoglycerol transferase MdoB-like AlkP superfamily enzyme